MKTGRNAGRSERSILKTTLLSAAFAAAVGLMGFSVDPVAAAVGDNKIFSMKVSPGASSCLPKAKGRVTVSDLGPVQTLHVEVSGLKPNTDYVFFVIQVPNAPFGLSWYQGDMETNDKGSGVGDFVGIFSNETFVVAPDQAVVPDPVHPGDTPEGSKNPAIKAPIHTYHLGVWFDSPEDAVKVGCPGTTTPFNGDHTAGIQVLNTANFSDDRGPLRNFP